MKRELTELQKQLLSNKKAPKKEQTLCQHEWAFKECKKDLKYLDDDNAPEKIVAEYSRIDMYFCKKCLKEKVVSKREIVPVGEDLKAVEPEWY
jgi:hypothetical protein